MSGFFYLNKKVLAHIDTNTYITIDYYEIHLVNLGMK